MRLNLVTLLTHRFDKLQAFYRKLLGVEPEIYRDSYAEFKVSGALLGLWDRSEAESYGLSEQPLRGNDSVIVEFEVDDVDAFYRKVQESGDADLMGELTTQSWGHRGFYLRDPEGRILNFYELVDDADESTR